MALDAGSRIGVSAGGQAVTFGAVPPCSALTRGHERLLLLNHAVLAV